LIFLLDNAFRAGINFGRCSLKRFKQHPFAAALAANFRRRAALGVEEKSYA